MSGRGEGKESEPSTSTCPVEMIPSRFSESTQHWLGVGSLNSCRKAYPAVEASVVSLGGKRGLPAEEQTLGQCRLHCIASDPQKLENSAIEET